MAQLKAVFFDAAGTLFETRAPVGLSYSTIARRYGVTADSRQVMEGFRRAFHKAPPLAFGAGRGAAELRRLERQWWRDVVAETFAELGTFSDFDAYFDTLFAFFASPANWLADPDAAPMLTALRERGLLLGIISNFDYRLYRILEGLGLAQWFDSTTISSEAGFAKPAPEHFAAALARHRLSPAEAVHVGDSEHHDLAGAKAAGIAAILIDHTAPDRLTLTGRTARVSSLAAVTEAIRYFA